MGDWKSGARTLLVNSEVHFRRSHWSPLNRQLEWREDGGEDGGDLLHQHLAKFFALMYLFVFLHYLSFPSSSTLYAMTNSNNTMQRLSALPQHNTLLLFWGGFQLVFPFWWGTTWSRCHNLPPLFPYALLPYPKSIAPSLFPDVLETSMCQY